MSHVSALVLAVSPEPVFSDWNFTLLRGLFRLLPHSAARDTIAQFFVDNALVSTWILAAAFYLYWRIQDERTAWRRTHLLAVGLVLCALSIATLALRPWIGWPAPVLAARFRTLYPQELWSDGNPNCFPSHSTFIYLLVAMGLWPLSRKLSALLMLWVLLMISLPRVYVGGHYPVDIAAGIVLAAVAAWLASNICKLARVRAPLEQIASKGLWFEVLVFLWLFELAEGFRSSYWMLTIAAKAAQSIW